MQVGEVQQREEEGDEDRGEEEGEGEDGEGLLDHVGVEVVTDGDKAVVLLRDRGWVGEEQIRNCDGHM